MRVTYADAMYVYFSDREVDKTVRVSSRVLVDLDAEGNIRGLEILFASKALVPHLLAVTKSGGNLHPITCSGLREFSTDLR